MSETFLRYVSGRLDTYRQAKALYAGRLAPDFTPFSFFDTGEVGLSRFISWLLDPLGSHAQGSAFLKAFLAWLPVDQTFDDKELASALVSTEIKTDYTETSGYIDIYVKVRDFSLVIENKPYALDQPNQIERYFSDLTRRNPNSQRLLYLSGFGNEPSSSSIGIIRKAKELESGRLMVRSYPDLIGWLAECTRICRANSVKVVLDGFVNFIEGTFMGLKDAAETRELATKIVGSGEMLDAALAVFEARNDVQAELIAAFYGALEHELKSRVGWVIERADLADYSHSGLIVNFSSDAVCGFGIQFDSKQFGSLLYGMQRKGGGYYSPQIKDILVAEFGQGRSASGWWPWWRMVSKEDRFFPILPLADRFFWLSLHNGLFLKMFMAYLDEVHGALERGGALSLLNVGAGEA